MPLPDVSLLWATVEVPKILVIENHRLGFLFRFLQISAVVWVLNNLVSSNAWLKRFEPVDYGLEFWSIDGNSELVAKSNVRHCAETAYFKYTYNKDFIMEPSACAPLKAGEAYVKTGSSMFFPTSVKDDYVWESSGNGCDAVQSLCTTKSGTYKSTNGDCSCSLTKQFLVQNAEQRIFALSHGYKVAQDATGKFVQVGRDRGSAEEGDDVGEKTAIDGEAGDILTIIQTPLGEECKVGGKSRWMKKDVANGLQGSIEDWLACAGLTLDDTMSGLASGSQDEEGIPRIRVAGSVMKFSLSYYNAQQHDEDWGGVVCYLRVSIIPMWNSNTDMSYSTIPDPVSKEGSYRHRYQYGISIVLESRGSFAFFDYDAFITAIVNALVLLSLPTTIIRFFTLNCVGLISNIYKTAQAQVLNILEELKGVGTRVMDLSYVFKLLALETGRDRLTPQDVHQQLMRALEPHIKDGTLNSEEVNCLVKILMKGEPEYTMTAWMEAGLQNEIVGLNEMVQLIDVERKRSPLERFFSDKRLDALRIWDQVSQERVLNQKASEGADPPTSSSVPPIPPSSSSALVSPSPPMIEEYQKQPEDKE